MQQVRPRLLAGANATRVVAFSTPFFGS
jgi:hypothetical protein